MLVNNNNPQVIESQTFASQAKSALYSAYQQTHETIQILVTPLFAQGIFEYFTERGNEIDVPDVKEKEGFAALQDPISLLVKNLFCLAVVQTGIVLCQKGWYRYVVRIQEPSEQELKIQRVAICQIGKLLVAMSRFFYTPQALGLILLQWTACFVGAAICVIVAKKADPFLSRHIYPITNLKFIQWPFKMALEIAKISAAVVLIAAAQELFCGNKLRDELVGTLVGPLLEEIIFRGLLQGTIRIIQQLWNHFYHRRELSEEELHVQQIVRIQITAFIFGISHASNSHTHLALKIFQCTWCYLGGVVYGYLAEKCDTLATPIIAHSINNTLAFSSQANLISVPVALGGLFINKIVSYEVGTGHISEAAIYCKNKLKAGFDYAASQVSILSHRIAHARVHVLT